MTIAVTGANGFVGSATLRALRALGLDPIALVQKPRGAHERRLDFYDVTTHRPALESVKALFLLRPPAVGDVERALFPVIDAAVAGGVQRIVFLSVQGAESRAYLPHAKVEAHLRTVPGHVAVGILRPGFFAQNLVSAYREDIVHDDRLYVCAGRGKVAFVDTEDLGDVAARALKDGALDGRAVAFSGAEANTFDDVAAELSAVLAREIRYVAASVGGFFWHRWRRRGASALEAFIVTMLHAGLRRGDGAHIVGGIDELLGRAPTTLRAVIERERALFARRGSEQESP